jgi:hypothetical protein
MSGDSGFVAIPVTVYRDQSLSMAARFVFGEILSYDWGGRGCFRSQQGMAKECGCSVRTIRSALKELEQRGLIRVARGTTARGGRRNTYYAERTGSLTVFEEEADVAGWDDGNRQEMPDQPAPDADEVDDVEVDLPPKRPQAVNRLSPEKAKAKALLQHANELLKVQWQSEQARGRALARVRQFPDLTVGDLRGVLDRIVAEAWWEREGSSPSIGTVFGAHVWERAVGAGGGKTLDDVNQENYRALERSAQ